MSTRARPWLAALFVLATAHSATVQAEPRAATLPGLNWVRLVGAEDCLSAAQLSERIEALVGPTVFVASSQAELFIDGYVQRTPNGFSVTLEVSDPAGRVLGHREFEVLGKDCSVIDDMVTFVVALTLRRSESWPGGGIPPDLE